MRRFVNISKFKLFDGTKLKYIMNYSINNYPIHYIYIYIQCVKIEVLPINNQSSLIL
jgi:hypothetical protein